MAPGKKGGEGAEAARDEGRGGGQGPEAPPEEGRKGPPPPFPPRGRLGPRHPSLLGAIP